MLKINRKVEYALIALKHISLLGGDDFVSAKALSEKYACPPEIMAKVLQDLVHAKILESIKGAGGGYKLIKSLSTVNFYELNESIIGSLALVDCLSGDLKICEQVEKCNIISPLYHLNKKVLELFKNITVEELVKDKKDKKEDEIKKNMLKLMRAS